MTRTIKTREEMLAFAGETIGPLVPKERATVVTLSGELGAGKTTFAQGVALTLGVTETVQSPTFVLEKIYALEGSPPAGGFTHLVHIDAYRFKSAHELRVLGWEELAREPGNLILIEWPERVAECMPQDAIRLRFDIDGDARIITINDGQKNT
ncbi:MAG: tRNA (adenosine(37)-N6)-threonylcarbamoyltransferase complex ATPase subunit type 1 TsaE [Minisyncoccota bacterium]